MKAKKMAETAFIPSANEGLPKATRPSSYGSGAGGAAAGRSLTPTAITTVKIATRMDATAIQPRNVNLCRVCRDANGQTIAAAMATQAAVQMACRESALKAVEMVRRAEPQVNVQTAGGRGLRSGGSCSRQTVEGDGDAQSQYAAPNSSPHHLPNMSVPQSEMESAGRSRRSAASVGGGWPRALRLTDLRVVELEETNLEIGPHSC